MPRTEPETRTAGFDEPSDTGPNGEPVYRPAAEDVLSRLERLAAAATPGPWERLAGDEGRRVGSEPVRIVLGPRAPVVARIESATGKHHADAAYIAAASPDVVSALVAAVRAAEELEAALFEEPADNMFGAPLMAEWQRRRNRAEDDLRTALQALQVAPEREVSG